ncbi:MAG: hybrid sensor histidine kinase/response regulator [Opitutaceae bacterium]
MKHSQDSQHRAEASILVVDDDCVCRELLQSQLESLGYRCACACDGEEGLALIESKKPSVVLLDLNMPKIGGVEFMSRLKDNDQLADIRIIVISSEEDTEVVAHSIQLGADDHIVKPFDITILNARVESSLAKYELRRLQATENKRLEHLVAIRTSDLKKANAQLASLDKAKNEFLTVLSHELRTPLNGLGLAEILLDNTEPLPREEYDDLMDAYHHSVEKLNEIVDHALTLSQLTACPNNGYNNFVSPNELVSTLMAQMPSAVRHKIELDQIPQSTGTLLVKCEPNLLQKAFQATIELAVKFNKHQQNVQLSCQTTAETLFIRVKSWGYTVPEQHLDKLFHVMEIPDTLFPGGEIGLGPAMAFQVMKLHSGDLTVLNHEEGGIVLSLELPLQRLPAAKASISAVQPQAELA